MKLSEFFKENPRAALAFSGGVDSSYLLAAASRLGADIRPFFLKTQFQPDFELEDARRVCGLLDIPLQVIELDILEAAPEIRNNPPQRCYICKRTMFTLLGERAGAEGCTLLLDGSNASDDPSRRPGMRALTELNVRSPLRECGLTKDDIRALSREMGLFTWDKPSYSCLATRLPTGADLTALGADL